MPQSTGKLTNFKRALPEMSKGITLVYIFPFPLLIDHPKIMGGSSSACEESLFSQTSFRTHLEAWWNHLLH